MIGYIYKITNASNGKSYIGQTLDFNRRVKRHIDSCKRMSRGETIHGHLYKAMVKYGVESFRFEIIFVVLDARDLNEYELFFISEYGTFGGGYNCNIGGGSSFGFKHSQDTRNKISKFKLVSNWQRGRPLTEHHKLKISKKVCGELNPFYGKTHDERVKKIISETHIGKTLSLKHRKILSECNSGSGNPMHGKIRQDVGMKNKLLKGYKLNYNGIIYDSMRDMSTVLHISRKTITNWIKSGKATKLPKE